MTKNFKVRLTVSLLLLAIASICLFTFNSIPFKIFFGTFAIVASLELFSFFKNPKTPLGIIFAIFELAFLVFGTIFISKQTALTIVAIILGVCGYDVFAYLFGGWLGGSIFGKARPFPHISKNKTWEGTIMGLVSSFVLVGITLLISGSTDHILLLCSPLALIGDLFESFLKRQFQIKDSNEIVIKNPLFAKLELLVGGSEGHGGYLDRIDSLAFTTAAILLLLAIL